MVTFTLKDEKLSMQEYFDLLKYLSKNLAVGLEMERPLPMQTDQCGHLLNARGNRIDGTEDDGLQIYKAASGTDYNVVFCYHDGSVHCINGRDGVEIVFGGTSENMKWIHDRLLKIESKLTENRCDEYHVSCSNHITLVTLQDRPIKKVVFRNLWNLTRAYSSALYWLASGDKLHLVRSQVFDNAKPNLNIAGESEVFGTSDVFRNKYNLLNIKKQEYVNITGADLTVQRQMKGVMIEFRNPDGFRVPSALASLMVMYRAMMMKALDLSLNGVLQIEGSMFDENKVLTNKILAEGQRDTKLTPQEAEKVVRQAKELISFLTPQLKAHSPEAIPVLYKLADKPVSFRSGKWMTIDKDLFKPNHNLTENETALIEMVVNHSITESTAGKWKKKASAKLRLSERMVEHMMARINEKTLRAFVYETELGSYVMRGG